MNPQDDEKLSKLLKASPSLKPPESFYRGVIEKIERKRAPVPWYFGYPVKGLATACVLVMLVLVVREKKLPMAPPSSPIAAGGDVELNRLSDATEVQRRVNRPISNLVENPSPFEDEDAKLRQELKIAAKKEMRAQAQGVSFGSAGQGQELDWKGAYSGVTVFRTVVITSSGDWETLWKEHTSFIVPPPPVPDVDFRSQMVVGIFDGTKPAGSYAVEITDIRVLPDNVLVSYRASLPPAGMGAVAVLTQPYHLRVIPKTSLPITFQKAP